MKGPTLIVIKSRSGRVFGGFTSKNWQSLPEGGYREDELAFLFSINKQRIYRVRKSSSAIYCHEKWGPSFGGNALGLKANPLNTENGSQCRTNGYGDGCAYHIRLDSQGNHEFVGEGKHNEDDKKEFTCVEVEVYSVVLEDFQ